MTSRFGTGLSGRTKGNRKRQKKEWRIRRVHSIFRSMIPESDSSPKTVRVLHVDDDPDIRLMISASLQEFGYVVATAGSNAEALKLAAELEFDLFILDVRLPDGSGIALCRKMVALQPGVPVLYYSAYASDEEQYAALSVCGDAYLKKPVSMRKLEQTIAALLEREK
jgi:two-component system, OmpR family, response regulator